MGASPARPGAVSGSSSLSQRLADGLGPGRLRWASLALVVALTLGVEEAAMASLREVPVRTASVWLGCFALLCVLLLAAVIALDGGETAAQYASIMMLNVMLSPDNLVVFMMFLKHAGLPLRHHRRVISDGFVLAIALRLGTILATGALLEAFAPLQTLLAALVFATSDAQGAHAGP